MEHIPVLYKEIIHALQPKRGCRYIDGTLGAGGHARGILEASGPDGQLLGLDLDPQALALARKNLALYEGRVHLVHASYVTLDQHMATLGWDAVDGIVLDLGLSSMQLDTTERGFSFQTDAPLDMRFDPTSGLTAAQWVNTASEADLTDILFRYGEEPRARKIVRDIIHARPVNTTRQLAEIVKQTYPGHSRVHPATRTFQALRIAVNEELESVKTVLPKAVTSLRSGGRLAVISFHSLEDRIVKDYFREQSKDLINPPYEKIYEVERKALLKMVTRKPIVPNEEEISQNPRARSAKLRVIERL